MTPVYLKDGRWQVRIPRKLSASGKRESRYFPTKSKAEKFVKEFRTDRREHGKAAVTAEERHWIAVARTELGSLDRIRDVLDHWKRTGSGVRPISASDAATAFTEYRKAARLNPGTKYDIAWRLKAFGTHFGGRQLHQITPGELEAWLGTYSEGWARRSIWKRIRPFFDYAKRRHWILQNPIDELKPPETGRAARNVYTPEQFKELLTKARETDTDVLLYIALAGLGFFRSQELVRRFGGEAVLEWSDIRFDRREIHVREEVAKTTRRKSGGERFVPIHGALLFALTEEPKEKRTGRVIPWSVRYFRKRLQDVFQKADVPFIDNGLRKSAISYWLAAYPRNSVGQVSQWAGNSEASCRQHYLKILSEEDGKRWFEIADEAFVKF